MAGQWEGPFFAMHLGQSSRMLHFEGLVNGIAMMFRIDVGGT